jgi:hypothetical protein
MVVYGAAHDNRKYAFLSKLARFYNYVDNLYIVGGISM